MIVGLVLLILLFLPVILGWAFYLVTIPFSWGMTSPGDFIEDYSVDLSNPIACPFLNTQRRNRCFLELAKKFDSTFFCKFSKPTFSKYTTDCVTQLALQKGDFDLCEESTNRDSCYSSYAGWNKQVEVCEKIVNESVASKCKGPIIKENYKTAKDPEVCKSILEQGDEITWKGCLIHYGLVYCEDSDEGVNTFVAGNATLYSNEGDFLIFSKDACFGTVRNGKSVVLLRETFCQDNMTESVNQNCSFGCKDGRCIS
tara:strand:- start:1031 stop:1798 length:768 start_codon:yes stop_codon:yes gene_type:complete